MCVFRKLIQVMMALAQMQPFTSSVFQFYKLSWFCKSVYAHMHVSSFLPVPEMQLPCRGNKTFFLKHQCKAGDNLWKITTCLCAPSLPLLGHSSFSVFILQSYTCCLSEHAWPYWNCTDPDFMLGLRGCSCPGSVRYIGSHSSEATYLHACEALNSRYFRLNSLQTRSRMNSLKKN